MVNRSNLMTLWVWSRYRRGGDLAARDRNSKSWVIPASRGKKVEADREALRAALQRTAIVVRIVQCLRVDLVQLLQHPLEVSGVVVKDSENVLATALIQVSVQGRINCP